MIIMLTPVEPDLFKSQIVNIMFNICDAMLGCSLRKDQQLHRLLCEGSTLVPCPWFFFLCLFLMQNTTKARATSWQH